MTDTPAYYDVLILYTVNCNFFPHFAGVENADALESQLQSFHLVPCGGCSKSAVSTPGLVCE